MTLRNSGIPAAIPAPAVPELVLPSTMAGFKVKKAVTMRLRKFKTDETIYIRILSQFKRAPSIGKKRRNAEGLPMEDPMMCEIIDLEAADGVVMMFIAPAVLRSELERNYPGRGVWHEDAEKWDPAADGYIGRNFAIQSFPRNDALKQRYRTFNIAELEE